MVFEHSPTEFSAQLSAQHEEAAATIIRAISWLHRATEDESGQVDATVILRELLRNAIVHGSGSDKAKQVDCRIRLLSDGQLEICVEDQGNGFDPARLFLILPADPLIEPERGLKLVNALADHLKFSEQGNQVTAYVRIGRHEEPDQLFSRGTH